MQEIKAIDLLVSSETFRKVIFMAYEIYLNFNIFRTDAVCEKKNDVFTKCLYNNVQQCFIFAEYNIMNLWEMASSWTSVSKRRIDKPAASPQKNDWILKFLLDVSPSVYTTDSIEWSNNMKGDIRCIYASVFSIASHLRILIEAQKRVDRNLMMRLITYSSNVFMRYKLHPIVLGLCIYTVSQAAINNML